jgi:hypothetical protein
MTNAQSFDDTQSLDNPFAVRVLDPKSMRLFRTHPEDTTVRATLEGDRSWREVRVARAFPLSDPDQYIGLRDGNDKDIGMLESLHGMDGESRMIIDEELERRYFTPQVTRVHSVVEAFGVVTWEVETTKGARRFLVRNLKDNSYTLGGSRVMMTDVDGNRYEFPDARALGPKALLVLSKIL